MMYLDLSEIDQVLSKSRLWSTNRFALARFRRGDFISLDSSEQSENVPLDESVRTAVHKALGFYPKGAIRLLTNLRYFGYIINPISCYYCFSTVEPERLEALLIEVTNTPWSEKTHYVLDLRNHNPDTEIDFDKALHVSPFMPMNMFYRWRGSPPDDTLHYSLENYSDSNGSHESRRFAAGVTLSRVEITGSSLNRILLCYPFMTAKVAIGIYWQALRLSFKRVPFVSHPAKQ